MNTKKQEPEYEEIVNYIGNQCGGSVDYNKIKQHFHLTEKQVREIVEDIVGTAILVINDESGGLCAKVLLSENPYRTVDIVVHNEGGE